MIDPERAKRFKKGYMTAEAEFNENDNPKYINPFDPDTPEHDGYEAAVYDFTQK